MNDRHTPSSAVHQNEQKATPSVQPLNVQPLNAQPISFTVPASVLHQMQNDLTLLTAQIATMQTATPLPAINLPPPPPIIPPHAQHISTLHGGPAQSAQRSRGDRQRKGKHASRVAQSSGSCESAFRRLDPAFKRVAHDVGINYEIGPRDGHSTAVTSSTESTLSFSSMLHRLGPQGSTSQGISRHDHSGEDK